MQFRPRPGILDLGWGHPHAATLPVEAWASAYVAAVRGRGADALTYGHGPGPGPLVEWLCGRLGVRPERLFVTAGASHALELVCATLVRPGDAVLVDAPTYHLALRTIADHTDLIVPVPSGAGPTADLIERLRASGRRVAMIYVVPVFNNPTGRSLSASRRAGLAALASETGAVLVEDETYRELAYDEPPGRSGAGPGVVSIGSFSKTVAPGLRLGWLVADPALVDRFADRGYIDSGGGVNHATALAMAEFGASGEYDRHLAEVRSFYRSQRDALVVALRRHAPSALFEVPAGGWYLWVRLPGVDPAGLLPRAEAAGVSYLPGDRFFAAPAPGEDHLRLSYSMLDATELAEAARRLGFVIFGP